MDDTNRIKFALHLEGWNYVSGDKKVLRKNAIKTTTTEYTLNMKGHIFCPECCVGLFRSPEDKEYNSLGKKAFYSHSRSHTPECSLRVKKAEEKKFENEELAKKAIDENSQEHGIDDESPGKIVIIFGKITESGIGLCIERFGWGEFAVLPDKYTHLLY